MLRVAVCDDSSDIRSQLRQYLQTFSDSSKIEIELSQYTSGEQLLAADYHSLDLLILDIQMDGLNGLDTARQIRCTDSDLTIIFFTNYVQYALEGYEVQAYRFLLKPLTYEQFSTVVGAALLEKQTRRQQTLLIVGRDKSTRIPTDDILYIETERGHVIIHTADSSVPSSASMKETEQALQDALFFRCHTAYLVPLRKIVSIGLQDIELQGGVQIPLSKHRRKALKEALALFWGGQFL